MEDKKDPIEIDEEDGQRIDDGLRQRIEGIVPEILRRTLDAGLGAVFTTEEGVRKMANDFTLPKDAARYLIQQAHGTKDELFRIFAAELRRFLDSLNLNEELMRLLTSMTFEIKSEIRLRPTDGDQISPKAKHEVTVRREPREDAEEGAEEGEE